MPFNASIAMNQNTKLRNLLFRQDPILGNLNTPYGRFEFLEMVACTDEELVVANSWNTRGMVSILAINNPLCVTDLARDSVLSNPEIKRQVEGGRERDGSSTGVLYAVNQIQWQLEKKNTSVKVTLTSLLMEKLKLVLKGRIPFGRDLHLLSESQQLFFVTAKDGKPKAYVDKDQTNRLVSEVTKEMALKLCEIPCEVGIYPLEGFDNYKLEIVAKEFCCKG